MPDPVRILFEDSDLLIVDKPSGLAAHGDQHHAGDETLLAWAKKYLPQSGSQAAFPHRLDKETSGLMIIAKTKEALRALNRQLKFKQIEKTYWAVLAGEIKPKGSIRISLRKEMDRKRWLALMTPTRQGGVHAQTEYVRLEIFERAHQKYSLVEAQPKTGRTHQLRAHFAAIGCPIVGDELYGQAELNAQLRQELGLSRMLLHAHRLKLEHPVTKNSMSLEAAIPAGFSSFLQELRKS